MTLKAPDYRNLLHWLSLIIARARLLCRTVTKVLAWAVRLTYFLAGRLNINRQGVRPQDNPRHAAQRRCYSDSLA